MARRISHMTSKFNKISITIVIALSVVIMVQIGSLEGGFKHDFIPDKFNLEETKTDKNFRNTKEVLIIDGSFQTKRVEFTENDVLSIRNADSRNYTLKFEGKDFEKEIVANNNSIIKNFEPGDQKSNIVESGAELKLDVNEASSRNKKDS